MKHRVFKNVINSQRALYQDRFLEYGDTPQGFFWNDRETQNLRFEKLFSHLLTYWNPISPPTIHEIGCGTADLHGYLNELGIHHIYSGTEVVEESTRTALAKYSDIKIQNRNFLESETNEKFDFVVLSGLLNYPTASEKVWKAYVSRMIEQMFSICRCGIAFNFLSSATTVPPNPDLYYIQAEKMLGFCRSKLSRFIILDQSYPLYEVTMTVLRPSYIETKWGSAGYEKYFR
jgi:hypothetical protein